MGASAGESPMPRRLITTLCQYFICLGPCCGWIKIMVYPKVMPNTISKIAVISPAIFILKNIRTLRTLNLRWIIGFCVWSLNHPINPASTLAILKWTPFSFFGLPVGLRSDIALPHAKHLGAWVFCINALTLGNELDNFSSLHVRHVYLFSPEW